ncbi:hypothetical protein AGR6A_pTi0134 [Agrobacterium sp. NCPPB 925]|nr:hypothetical protein AGR6A_pTi0134 [Agrobacterium sp. NCPPB 925]
MVREVIEQNLVFIEQIRGNLLLFLKARLSFFRNNGYFFRHLSLLFDQYFAFVLRDHSVDR